jgi:hypothetical protein
VAVLKVMRKALLWKPDSLALQLQQYRNSMVGFSDKEWTYHMFERHHLMRFRYCLTEFLVEIMNEVLILQIKMVD